jgi:prepilin-type N-terminal cleavage/methylation domain-containing protein
MTLKQCRGFTLLEMMIAIAFTLIITAIAFISLRPGLNKAHLDTAYNTTLMALRNTRHLAITQNHEYVVSFDPAGFPAGTIEVQYQPPAVGGVLPPLQLVNTYSIPGDVSFAVQGGFPAAAPDSFGSGLIQIDFGQGLGGGNLTYVAYMPDGSSRDTLGNYNSGIVYLTRPSDTIYSSRAITVWGATGRIRGWRLNQQAGGATWVQQ